jgi:hypothetical protein
VTALFNARRVATAAALATSGLGVRSTVSVSEPLHLEVNVESAF